MRTGTYGIEDLRANRGATIAELGLDNVNQAVQDELGIHNALVSEMMARLAGSTTERLLRSGVSGAFEFVETDEYARDDTQKALGEQTVGIPLWRFSLAVGWDVETLLRMTAEDMLNILTRIQTGDRVNIAKSIKTALFTPTNYTFWDKWGRPQVDLPVKALYNADSSDMGIDINGQAINGATHTHFLAAATLTEALINSAVATVVEHGYTEGVEIFVNETNVDGFRGLDGFTRALGPLVTAGNGVTVANVTDTSANTANTTVGVWNERHVVRTKPWVPAGYFAVVAVGQSDDTKALAFREDENAAFRGLRVIAEEQSYPLRARWVRRFYGIGVRNRGAAAVADFTHANYTQPTF